MDDLLDWMEGKRRRRRRRARNVMIDEARLILTLAGVVTDLSTRTDPGVVTVVIVLK